MNSVALDVWLLDFEFEILTHSNMFARDTKFLHSIKLLTHHEGALLGIYSSHETRK